VFCGCLVVVGVNLMGVWLLFEGLMVVVGGLVGGYRLFRDRLVFV